MDEVRVSNLPRSADWVQASYSNQVAGTAFSRYGVVSSNAGMLIIVR